MVELVVRNLGASAGAKSLCHDVSFHLSGGEMVALVGPNGAGKSSLLRAIIGLNAADGGRADIDGQPIAAMTSLQRARAIAYLPQDHDTAWPISVAAAVALGRYAYGATPHRLSAPDQAIVDGAMQRCNIAHLAAQSTATLSGGERARVALARTFAAQTPLALLDEPVAALDLHQQHGAMAEIRRYADAGDGALLVLHDIGLAAHYADRLLWMADGCLMADTGTDAAAISAQVRALYGFTPIIGHDASGRIVVVSASTG